MNNYLRTKLITLTVALWVGVFCDVLLAQASNDIRCDNDNRSSSAASLHLPIIFSFKDFSLRREDIYNSLNPRFEENEYISWGSDKPVETKFDMASGRFTMHFCLLNWKEPNQSVMLNLKLGLSQVELPIKATGLHIERNADSTTLIHPPIILLDQPSPDWMIPIRSGLSHTPNGESVIDFQIYNPSSKGLIGPYLNMVSRRYSGIACAVSGPTHESRISIKLTKGTISSGGIQIVSTEPNYQDPVIRVALVEKNLCSFGTRVTIPLGETTTIKPDEIVRFVYKVSGAELLGKSNIILKFHNARIYPTSTNLGSL